MIIKALVRAWPARKDAVSELLTKRAEAQEKSLNEYKYKRQQEIDAYPENTELGAEQGVNQVSKASKVRC